MGVCVCVCLGQGQGLNPQQSVNELGHRSLGTENAQSCVGIPAGAGMRELRAQVTAEWLGPGSEDGTEPPPLPNATLTPKPGSQGLLGGKASRLLLGCSHWAQGGGTPGWVRRGASTHSPLGNCPERFSKEKAKQGRMELAGESGECGR